MFGHKNVTKCVAVSTIQVQGNHYVGTVLMHAGYDCIIKYFGMVHTSNTDRLLSSILNKTQLVSTEFFSSKLDDMCPEAILITFRYWFYFFE